MPFLEGLSPTTPPTRSVLRDTTRVSLLAALAYVLMLAEVPIMPGADFLRYDAGDIPVLIGAFALGPWKGVSVAGLKCALYLLFHMTPYAWAGAPMNFLAGATFALVAGYVYQVRKTRVRAIASLVLAGIATTAVMLAANVLLWPWIVALFLPGVPSHVPAPFLLGTLLPFNLIKSAINGVLCFVVYKRISPVLKAAHWELPSAPAPARSATAPARL